MKQNKRRRRNRPLPQDAEAERKTKVVAGLMEAFGSVSLDDASSAYKEANGDLAKAAEILVEVSDEVDQSTSSVSSGMFGSEMASGSGSCTSSGGSEGASEGIVGFARGQNKQKNAVATAGMVSNMLGKEYVRRREFANGKGFGGLKQE